MSDISQEIMNEINNIENNNMLYTQELSGINNKNRTIEEKQIILNKLNDSIEKKEKLLLTRSRMLQISTDRNSYKQKLIYSLIGFAMAIFIIILIIYFIIKKNVTNIKNK